MKWRRRNKPRASSIAENEWRQWREQTDSLLGKDSRKCSNQPSAWNFGMSFMSHHYGISSQTTYKCRRVWNYYFFFFCKNTKWLNGHGTSKTFLRRRVCSLCLTICDKVYTKYRYSNRGGKRLLMLIQRHQAYLSPWNQKDAKKEHFFVFCMFT
jgi:hypothetical protein